MGDERVFVIVGASLAGAKAAEALRAEGFRGRIVLVGEETERPYERPPLSKGYLNGTQPRDKAYVHDAAFYVEKDIDLLLGVTVTGLDPKEHTVTLDSVEPLRYDRLLLATGSRVRRLDVPGSDNRGIRYLRTLPDADAIIDSLRGGSQVLVVGAGWIGLETAAAAREKGAEVTVVEMDTLPLRRVLGDEVAAIFAEVHRAHGVHLRFSCGVAEFGGLGGDLTHAVLTDGAEVAADLAVVGVGIRPAIELAEAGGLAVDNGIVTDSGLRTSDPDVFACGDVANSANPLLGRSVRVEHWANALNGGRAAAKAMLGQDVVYDRVPYFFSDQYTSEPSIGLEYSGYVEPGGYDQVVFRGDPTVGDAGSPEFIAFWVKDGRVLAGMNVNVWDVVEPIQALVRAGWAGRAVDLAQLADPAVPLTDLLD
jgi:3-phenylpropionate/trans-cinnamate dioxygenase ferredoxin reductase subunit